MQFKAIITCLERNKLVNWSEASLTAVLKRNWSAPRSSLSELSEGCVGLSEQENRRAETALRIMYFTTLTEVWFFLNDCFLWVNEFGSKGLFQHSEVASLFSSEYYS